MATEPYILSNGRFDIKYLYERIEPLMGYIDHKVQNVKTKEWYTITGIHYRASDMSVEFSCKTYHRKTPITFVFPISDLLNGKFDV